jgi:hypothetical protein
VNTAVTAWQRLGDLLVTRRVQIDPRYTSRRTFVAETHSGKQDSWYRMITSVENGSRDNYSRETLAAIEIAYQLQPGSLNRTLTEGGALEPLQQPAPPQAPADSPDQAASSMAMRDALDEFHAAAGFRSLGDVLVQRGIRAPEELTRSDQTRHDPIVSEIIDDPEIPDDAKDRMLAAYSDMRKQIFDAVKDSKKKPRD